MHFRNRADAARGLEQEGVPRREREREHPERDHGREVEGRDARADAERLAERIRVDLDNCRSELPGCSTLEKVFAYLQKRNITFIFSPLLTFIFWL